MFALNNVPHLMSTEDAKSLMEDTKKCENILHYHYETYDNGCDKSMNFSY